MTGEEPRAGDTTESERRYRLLAENISDVIWICDVASQRFVYVSPSIEKLRGFTVDEVKQGSVADSLSPGSNARIQALLLERLAAFERGVQTTYTDELEQPHKDGRLLWVELVTRFVRDPDTGRLHVYGTSRDITERKKNELALRQLTRIHRTLSAANEAIALAGSEGDLLHRICCVLAEHLGVAGAIVFAPDPTRRELRAIAAHASERPMPALPLHETSDSPSVRAFLTGQVVSEGRFRDRAASARWSHLSSVVERVASVMALPVVRDSKVWGVLAISAETEGAFEPEVERLLEGLARSISRGLDDIERAEALRASEERYRTLVENLEDIVYSVDLSGRVMFMSGAIQRLGLAPDAAIGRTLFDLVHPQDLPAVRAAFAEGLAGQRAHIEHRIFDASGRTRFVRTSLRLTRGPQDLSWISGVIADRTQQHEVEEQLRVAQKMEAVGRLAGGIAHDFNNLLLVIMSYTDLVMEELPEGQPVRADLEEVRSASTRAAGLTRQLLAFSRKQRLQTEIIDVPALVNGLEKMLRRLLGEDVDLVVRRTPSTQRICADSGQIEQVIMNLAVNARDAMPDGGTLVIEAGDAELDAERASRILGATPGPCVRLAITDTGTGMDEATQARVFEPFFTTKGPGKGTGLGLATVYGIVKQTGGCIALSSTKGVGTRFEIFLPAASDAPLSKPVAPSPRGSLKGHQKVLLVEDEAVVRSLVRRVLASAGYEVLVACTGEDALELSTSYRDSIDLLITDVVLPGMNGLVLSDRITRDRPQIQVLFTSGYTDDELAQRGGLRRGARLLPKPFSAGEILRTVRELFDDQPIASPKREGMQ